MVYNYNYIQDYRGLVTSVRTPSHQRQGRPTSPYLAFTCVYKGQMAAYFTPQSYRPYTIELRLSGAETLLLYILWNIYIAETIPCHPLLSTASLHRPSVQRQVSLKAKPACSLGKS